MPDLEAIDERLRTIERALGDGEEDFTALSDAAALTTRLTALERRVSDLAEQVDDVDASTQALRGYVGNVRSALANVTELQRRFDGDDDRQSPTACGPQTDEETSRQPDPPGSDPGEVDAEQPSKSGAGGPDRSNVTASGAGADGDASPRSQTGDGAPGQHPAGSPPASRRCSCGRRGSDASEHGAVGDGSGRPTDGRREPPASRRGRDARGQTPRRERAPERRIDWGVDGDTGTRSDETDEDETGGLLAGLRASL